MISFKHYINEMDKSQDYSFDPRGQNPELKPGQKAHYAKAVSIKKATSRANDILNKAFIDNKKKKIDEDGGVAASGPTNVTGPQSSTDPVSATAVNKKRKVVLQPLQTRTPPKM